MSRMTVDSRHMILLLKIVMISIPKGIAKYPILNLFSVVQRFPGFNPSTVSRATISQTPIPDYIEISQ